MEQFIILKIFRQTGLNLNEKGRNLVRPANITEDIGLGKCIVMIPSHLFRKKASSETSREKYMDQLYFILTVTFFLSVCGKAESR